MFESFDEFLRESIGTRVRRGVIMAIKLNPVWSSKRMAVLDGRQVRCTTFDEGSVWIHGLDKLPPPVRRRLANSRFNICPTCVAMDTRRNGEPTLKLYFAVIEAIERTLERAERRFNDNEVGRC